MAKARAIDSFEMAAAAGVTVVAILEATVALSTTLPNFQCVPNTVTGHFTTLTIALLGQNTTWDNASTMWTALLAGTTVISSSIDIRCATCAVWTLVLGAGTGAIDISDGSSMATVLIT